MKETSKTWKRTNSADGIPAAEGTAMGFWGVPDPLRDARNVITGW